MPSLLMHVLPSIVWLLLISEASSLIFVIREMPPLRWSRRIRGLSPANALRRPESESLMASASSAGSGKRRKGTVMRQGCLPRCIETRVKDGKPGMQVVGVDEAGRGPLAGPVVAAAVICPQDTDGIVDSKKITKEEHREAAYDRLVSLPGVRWAVAVVDAPTIDSINILQATMLAMRMATTSVLAGPEGCDFPSYVSVSSEITGCYVVNSCQRLGAINHSDAFALVDGNRLPKDMPCGAEAIVKGDSKEFLIAAASILAKVSRDRLMLQYHDLYPMYNLRQHKGYPTRDHISAVQKLGVTPIHRMSFAPLKHMEFDVEGKPHSATS